MNQLPNAPGHNLGSLLAYRRPIINLSSNFQSLTSAHFQRAPVDKSEIIPWSDFTFENIVNAYGDVLQEVVDIRPLDEVREVVCQNHVSMIDVCNRSFYGTTPLCIAIAFGRETIGTRLSNEADMAYSIAESLEIRLPEHAQNLNLRNTGHVHVFYNEKDDSSKPFLATAITVPSCAWKPDSLVTANHDNQPELGPIEQLAACAEKTNTCFSFIMGDKDIVVLQFFHTGAGSMGVY